MAFEIAWRRTVDAKRASELELNRDRARKARLAKKLITRDKRRARVETAASEPVSTR